MVAKTDYAPMDSKFVSRSATEKSNKQKSHATPGEIK